MFAPVTEINEFMPTYVKLVENYVHFEFIKPIKKKNKMRGGKWNYDNDDEEIGFKATK